MLYSGVHFYLRRASLILNSNLISYTCMDLQDKILSTVLDIQLDVKNLGVRISNVESVQEKVYNKLERVTQAILKMKKFDMGKLQEAYQKE